MAIEHDQVDTASMRLTGKAEIANNPHNISASLRHNRPQSAAEEQDLLDLVRKQLEWERAYDEALRTGTQADDVGDAAWNDQVPIAQKRRARCGGQ